MNAVITAVEVGARVLPSLIEMIRGLVEGGMSADEAEDIVRNDIRSRAEEYDRQKAEDEAALSAKHGRS